MGEAAESAAFRFCIHCGQRLAVIAPVCPQCGGPQPPPPAGWGAPGEAVSPKSFGTAMALNAVFGILGIHHFYLGNIFHGLIDLVLSLTGLWLIITSDPERALGAFLLGVLLLVVDGIHSLVVMILLITGKARDGQGRLVAYPGQIR